MPFQPVQKSLADLVGDDFVEAAACARAALTGEALADLHAAAHRQVDFFPRSFEARLKSLLPETGTVMTGACGGSSTGAGSRAFAAANRRDMSPLSALGYYRISEDGVLRFISKSGHYHVPLGHGFPGYALLDAARRLGIPNATHNNTRGHITRVLEERLLEAAGPATAPDRTLNGVLNLETGSLVCEAALKMMLHRFYRVAADDPTPPRYAGRVPVFLVVGDRDGELQANYHGTTVVAQLLRGMWPDLREALQGAGLMQVATVRPNRVEDLETAFDRYERDGFKIAGFLHEIVMMNYGAVLLSDAFLKRAYELCREHDVPTLVDEIQTCVWSPRLYLFRELGIEPAMVAVGKGLPGGEYAASRLLFTEDVDTLPLFGALVTNGQEELASLAYLVTMQWARANAAVTAAVGERYEARLRELGNRYAPLIAAVHGSRHMMALHFHELSAAKQFTACLVEGGLDISVQTYKTDCPPAALTKLPLIVDNAAVDMVVDRMHAALADTDSTSHTYDPDSQTDTLKSGLQTA